MKSGKDFRDILVTGANENTKAKSQILTTGKIKWFTEKEL